VHFSMPRLSYGGYGSQVAWSIPSWAWSLRLATVGKNRHLKARHLYRYHQIRY